MWQDYGEALTREMKQGMLTKFTNNKLFDIIRYH